MGAKPRAYADTATVLESVPAEHRPRFEELRGMIRQIAPEAVEVAKWGTIQYDYKGSLFGLGWSKGRIQLYILTIGLLARHQEQLGHLDQGKCVLRLDPNRALPGPAIAALMKEAVALKS